MIEQLARSGAQELRTRTGVDPEAGLADLHVRQARHRRRAGLAAAAAVLIALGVGAGTATLVASHHDRAAAPTHRPSSSPSTATDLTDPVCVTRGVECLGDRTYRFALTRPVVWALPPGFQAASGGGVMPLMVESYRAGSPTAGVTVMERVRAASPHGGPAPGVGRGPGAFVRWVAERPFLEASRVRSDTLDGHRAWQVRVSFERRAGHQDGSCDGPCRLITYQPDRATTGMWDHMAAEYTAFRIPGGGTTVVWSWIFTGDPRDLDGLEATVHSLSWSSD